MRWSQAWMLLAGAMLLEDCIDGTDDRSTPGWRESDEAAHD